MTPERYVALWSHKWMLGGPLAYSYSDPEVEAHVRRVEELLRSDDLDAVRKTWLSPEEYERVRAEITEMQDPDYGF